jgi:hypothetical protein
MSTIIANTSIKIPANATATLTLPDGSLKPAVWSSDAADVFPASKLQVPRFVHTNFGLASSGTPVARVEAFYTACAAGTINKFAALLSDTGTSTDIDFILLKNGVSLMSSDLTITHGTSDGVVVEGTLTSTTYSAGDKFTIQIVVNSSTGAQGPYAFAEFLEVLS